MSAPKVGALFAGYGGVERALHEVLGAEPAWFSQYDPQGGDRQAPSRILAHHWPDVPNHGDITRIDWATVEPVDIITGGFPCQDVSLAGRREGLTSGTRTGLWAHMLTAIDKLRPRIVVAENVRGLLSAKAESDVEPCPWCMGGAADGEPPLRALGAVLGDLADIGYDAAWTGLRAADVGAAHGRFRIFVLAWPRETATGDLTWPRETAPGDLTWPRETAPGDLTWPRETAPGDLLRTPTAQLAINGGSQHPDKRMAGGHSPTLADQAEHLLLGTPRAADGMRNQLREHENISNPRARLEDQIALLATPRVAATRTSRGAADNSSSSPSIDQCIEIAQGILPREFDTWEDMPASWHGGEHLLPTPTARDLKGHNQRNDDSCLTGALLPTPRATDGEKGGPNQRGSSGDLMLPSAVTGLLPTPSVADALGGHERRGGQRGDELLLNGMAKAGRLDRFGPYAAAIARWESVTGRPAPDPTEPTGRNGGHRLSPAFVEWLMGLPDGWVTAVPDITRNDMLKALGNGVVPQQCAAAVRHLLGIRRHALRITEALDGAA